MSHPKLKQANGKPYENTERCWQYLCQASKTARYLALVSIADIADHKNPEPHVFAGYKDSRNLGFEVYSPVPELEKPYITMTGFDRAAVPRYHLEVWVEKSTMNDVLLPIGRDYGANLVTGEGELSITAVHRLVLRLRQARKPGRMRRGLRSSAAAAVSR